MSMIVLVNVDSCGCAVLFLRKRSLQLASLSLDSFCLSITFFLGMLVEACLL